jgi:uncharacterized protein (TIGR00661 family)
MVNIVYGVSGEGSGHSSRAREMLTHLQTQGHRVKVASYDRGYRNLQKDFDTLEITGLSIASEDNRVSALKTISQNLASLPRGLDSLETVKQELFKSFRPDCVITDFEPMTAYLANHYEIPLISLDNQHRMRYMEYPCPKRYKKDALITETVIRAMVPKPDVSLIITFYYGKLKNLHSFLFPPILRSSVLELNPTQGEHILVYVTAGFDTLLQELKTYQRERFRVYGYDKDEQDGPLQFRAFSNAGFLQDLATAKGVIATAGFTLMSEALYLSKPYLALPMQGQFEQMLNGLMLKELGYGKNASRLRSDTIAAFLYRLPDYAEHLQAYDRQGNQAITGKLDELLADDCRLLKRFHK